MSTVQEIESAIEKLPRHELWQLKARLDRRCEDDWDAQIEEDARPGGPLDQLSRQAIAEFQAGRCKPLP
jgi:hypothetical protein